MPTSAPVDTVAKTLAIPFYEPPTGWKFFGTLLDAGKITIYGEESFGNGSDHAPEEDLWVVLFWLSTLTAERCSVATLMERHWATYGRHYDSRHDDEGVEQTTVAESYGGRCGTNCPNWQARPWQVTGFTGLTSCPNTDLLDGTTSSRQGLRILLQTGSRITFRLSGTGMTASTMHLMVGAGDGVEWTESGRQDLNLRHLAPKASALPNCATPRYIHHGSHPSPSPAG